MYLSPVGEDVGAVVADIGAFSTRIGFAGDDIPKTHCPTLLGVSNITSNTTTTNKREFFFDLSNFRQNISIESPLRDGVIYDWEMFEKLFENSLKSMRINSVETPILMGEKVYNPSINRQKTCELMFEKFNSPGFFLAKDSALACFALGKTTGLSIDFGTNGTVITPVIDGWSETKALNRTVIGGRYIDAYVLTLLKAKGLEPLPLFRLVKTVTQDKRILVSQNLNINSVHPTYDALMRLEIGRDLKESSCRMADSTLLESDPRYSNIPLVPYELPDGTMIDLGIERFQIPELLCDPSPSNLFLSEVGLIGLGQPPHVSGFPIAFEAVPRLATDSILRCESENQTVLFNNIVISGGTSRFEGLPDRIKVDMESIVHMTSPTVRLRTLAAAPTERGLCTWLGGSILASLSSFHDMWMTKQEYAEYGSLLIDKKCP